MQSQILLLQSPQYHSIVRLHQADRVARQALGICLWLVAVCALAIVWLGWRAFESGLWGRQQWEDFQSELNYRKPIALLMPAIEQDTISLETLAFIDTLSLQSALTVHAQRILDIQSRRHQRILAIAPKTDLIENGRRIATAKIFNFNAAQQTKAKASQDRDQSVSIEFPRDGHPDGFYPEMGETRNPTKIIFSTLIYDCYSAQWAEGDNETVMALFKELKIRPKRRSRDKEIENIRYEEAGAYSRTSPFTTPTYSCLITFKAHDKLSNAGVISTEILLD